MRFTQALPTTARRAHVDGSARYVDDLPEPPGLLHLAFGLAQDGYADFEQLELSAVRSAPGVVAAPTTLPEIFQVRTISARFAKTNLLARHRHGLVPCPGAFHRRRDERPGCAARGAPGGNPRSTTPGVDQHR